MEEKGGATRTSRRPALPALGSKKIHKLTRVYSASDSTPSFEAILVTEKRLVLGREPGADGWKVDDPDASRRHAELAYVTQHDGFRLKDLGSKNGTFLNAQRVGETEHLQNGSVLRIGQSLIVYETIE